MFIRKKKNKSGSISIQIIDKSSGRYTVIKTIGCVDDDTQREQELVLRAHEFISVLTRQSQIDFSFSEDTVFLKQLQTTVVNREGIPHIKNRFENTTCLSPIGKTYENTHLHRFLRV